MKIYQNNYQFLTSLQNLKQKCFSNLSFVKRTYNNLKNKIKNQKQNFLNSNEQKLLLKQAFIYKKFQPEFEKDFQVLREKILNYIEDDYRAHNLIPEDSRIYVNVHFAKTEPEILSSYQSVLFYRTTKKNSLVTKTELEYKKDYDSYCNYFTYFLRLRKYFRLPRRGRFEFMNLHDVYKFTVKKQYLQRRVLILKNQNAKLNSLIFGFLGQSDALLYKKKIIRDHELTFIINKRFKKQNIPVLDDSIKIESTTLSDVQNALEKFEDFEKIIIKPNLILIPKFFNYNLTDKRQTGLINFPDKMLTKTGFYGVPLYKTKPIAKKFLISNNKNFKDLPIPRKYLEGKKFFITLDKQEYEDLLKRDKKNFLFHKEETDFTDNIKSVIAQRNKMSLVEINHLFNKIKIKCQTVGKLQKVKKFFSDNYNEDYLLEKTSHYIDTIH